MKLTIILLVAFSFSTLGKGLSQEISLSFKNASLEKVMHEVRKQSGYAFIFNAADLKHAKGAKITTDLNKASIQQALRAIFDELPYSYEVKEKSIVLKLKKQGTAHRQVTEKIDPSLTIQGKVVDSLGRPLVGATVRVKGSKLATSTHYNGEFSLEGVDEGAVLVISFIGYNTKQVFAVKEMETIVLMNISDDLEEVMVSTGYWTTTKKLNTGNVAKVTSKDIEKQPILNVITALQGRVPGLDITESGGLPGSLITVRIRGNNSIAGGNDPLYVVDGIPYSSESLGDHQVSRQLAMGSYGIMNTLNTLNGADIESIEVLKDADATAIYGSRGANGVILITTKKGKAGKTKFDFSMNGGLNTPTRFIDVLNTEEYIKMRKDAYAEDGTTTYPAAAYDVNGGWDTARYTNWFKELTGRSASRMSTQLSMSGGNELTQFLISGNFLRQVPSFPKGFEFNYNKTSAHVNVNHRSENKKFFANITTNYATDFNNSPGDDITRAGGFLAPNAPKLYNDDGSLHWEAGFNNPLAVLNSTYEAVTKSLIANLNTGYQIMKGLELKSSFGFSEYLLNEYYTNPNTIYNPEFGSGPDVSYAFANTGSRSSWIIEPQLTFKRKIGRGMLDVMAGSTFQQNVSKKKGENGSNFPSNSLIYDLKSAVIYSLRSSSHSLYKYNAFYGRINYNWEGKYILNFTGRRDGSSRFGPGKQFANFGAVGAAWIFSEEGFLGNQHILSFGKLRASYGLTGNDQIGDYEFLNTYQNNGKYGLMAGMIPSRHFNEDFSWEENKKLEFGLEFGLFKDVVMASVSYFQNRSGNQLVGMPLSGITGFTSVRANLGAVVENKGLEIEMNSKNINTKDFSWSTNFNYSYPKNKLISYPGLASSPYADIYVIGQPLDIKKTYNYTGIDPVKGIYTFEDINKDGFITLAGDRKMVVYKGIKYTASLGNTLNYKNLQLDIFFQYVNKTGENFIYARGATGGYGMANFSRALLDNWTYNKDNPTYQRLSSGGNQEAAIANTNIQYSNITIADASFLRLKNVTLNYNLPKEWLGLLGRIYVQGQNLLTFTKYQGSDPESAAVTYMPPLKVWNFGLQITF